MKDECNLCCEVWVCIEVRVVEAWKYCRGECNNKSIRRVYELGKKKQDFELEFG